MSCLETEKLINYAYRLIEGPVESQVRAHVSECSRCREIVEQHRRLVAVLDEWTATEPTSAFDARVRQAVDALPARREAWSLLGWGWTRGLALASLGVLIVAGMVWLTHLYPRASNSSMAGTRHAQAAIGGPAPAQSAKVRDLPGSADSGVSVEQAKPEAESAAALPSEDKDTQALEDYDLAANFDVLSELRKGEVRVAN